MTSRVEEDDSERNLIVNYIPANLDDARLRVSCMSRSKTTTSKATCRLKF